MSSPRVQDISWDEEGAVLVYGETTEAEAEAAAEKEEEGGGGDSRDRR